MSYARNLSYDFRLLLNWILATFLSPEFGFWALLYTRKQMPDLWGQCIKALFRSPFAFAFLFLCNFIFSLTLTLIHILTIIPVCIIKCNFYHNAAPFESDSRLLCMPWRNLLKFCKLHMIDNYFGLDHT
jgi:hypothetical protein